MKISAIQFDNEIAKLTKRFTGREWVFDEIERWLKQKDERFFILTGEPGIGKSAIAAQLTKTRQDIAAYHFCIASEGGTIQPYGVLLSLTAQLIESIPNYAETLVNVIKPLKLSVEVEISIQTINDSTLRAVVIQHLHSQSAQEALDIVLRRSLVTLPNQPTQPILILIDSLDEAVTYGDKENLVTLLAGVNDLPSWVRFIFTSRPDEQRVLSYLKSLKPYPCHLDKLSPNNLQDIHKYTTERVGSEAIQRQLEKFQVESSTLVNQIDKCDNSNFLYTKLLLDDIESGELPLDKDNLVGLPKNLDDLYHKFLLRLMPEWSKYQIVLGVLTVTKAPLTEEELTNIVNDSLLEEKDLVTTLRVVQQFLDVIKDNHGQNTYRLFHQSFREYLVDKKRNQNFRCSPKDEHKRIVECYWQYHPNDWVDCDRYALKFFASHLVELAALEKPPVKGREYIKRLHKLLATEVDGRNVWFEAKKGIGDTAGFVTDVKLAWKQVGEKEFQQEPEIAIGLQCRYALMTSSINSLSGNIPTSLVIELMKRDSAKGLPYVQQLILNQRTQSPQVLNTFTLHLVKPKLVQNLLETAQAISNKDYQTQVQSALAKYLSEEKLREVFEAAQTIQNEEDRACAISMLIPYLPSDQHLKTLDATQAIQHEYYRAKVFSTLAQYLKDLLPNIIDMLRTIKSADYRTDALIGVIPHLPEKLLPEALKVVLEIPRTDEYSQTRALCGLAAASNLTVDMLGKIQKAAEVFENKNYRTQVRSALAPHLSLNQLYKVLEEVQKIKDEYHRSQVLSALASRLPSDQLHKILEQAQAIHDEHSRSVVLSSLSHAPPDLLYKVLEEIQKKIKDEYNLCMALSKLATAPNFNTDLLEKIQKQAEAFQDNDYRIQVLSKLAPHLSLDQLYKVLEQAQEIQDKYDRSLALSYLASHLPLDQLYKVLKEVQKIQDEYIGSIALSKLANAPNLTTELREKIQKQAETFQNKDYRTKVLSSLIQYLSEERRLEVLEAAREIENEEDQAQVMNALVLYVPSDQQAKILKTVIKFQYQQNQTQVLSILNPYLSSEQLHEILEEVQAIPDEYHQCLALSSLAAHLPPNQLYNLLEQVQAFQDEDNQTEVLSGLASAPNLTTDLREKIQKQAEAFQDQHNRIQILSLLAPYLQPKDKQKIFEEVQAIQDEYYRSLALSRLVPSLSSNQLQEALKATQEIQNEFNRGDILKVLAPELAKLPRDELYRLWSSTLHILANRNREHLLADIRELTPVIFSLGKHEAIVKICDAIWEIGQQWP